MLFQIETILCTHSLSYLKRNDKAIRGVFFEEWPTTDDIIFVSLFVPVVDG